jgi:predicted nucleic acid-binding protein
MRIAWQNVKRTGKLVDTSVLIKWFHSEGELPHARALRSAHVAGELDAHILDLATYELGNVLVRAAVGTRRRGRSTWRSADRPRPSAGHDR